MEQSEQINELAKALCAFQAEVETAKKGSQGYGYKYSDLSQVISTAKPILAKNHLSVSQSLSHTEQGHNTIVTTLLHASGQYMQSECIVPNLQAGKNMNAAQALGASISYMRRYAYQAILGMTSEDNDAVAPQMQQPQFQQPQQGYHQR
jgi:hypothetical protein